MDDVTMTNEARPSGTAAVRGAPRSPTGALDRIVHFVSDGTGRSPEEVRLLLAATVAVAVSAAAVRGLIWTIDLLTDLQVEPA